MQRLKCLLIMLSIVSASVAHVAAIANDATVTTHRAVESELPQKFDPKRNALGDLQTAINLAAEGHKRILIDVGGDWCEGCRELDLFFEGNSDLRAKRDNAFVWLKVNVSDENKNEPLIKKFPWFFGYPHWFVLDENGKVLHSSFAKGTRQEFEEYLVEWAPSSKH
jgi:thiol:disulfide interchange protein